MPSAAIFPASLAIPKLSNRSLTFCRAFTGPNFFLPFSNASSTLTAGTNLALHTSIRMGGGPRTYPGGVSKWQWKRMQAKKSKQLLKARLCRERQLYEMRKRAELKAAISELERPWEVVERAPVLFSTSADEQVKALADRFQRPSGFDMWSERDGPRLFRSSDDLPSARFFPKGAVHSVKPYGVIAGEVADGVEEREKMMRYHDWVLPDSDSLESEGSTPVEGRNGRSYSSDSELVDAGSKKAENHVARYFDCHGRNRGSQGSDSVLAVDGARMKEEDMESEIDSRGFRSQSTHGSDSRMERRQMTSRFRRRGSGDGRGRYHNANGSHLHFAVNGTWMERNKNSSDRNQGSSDSELTDTGSRMQRHEMAIGLDRGRGRGGRGRNRGSYASYSELGSRMPRHEMASGSDRGRGSGRGGRNYRSYSELAVAGSMMEGEEIASGFGKRSRRGVNRKIYDSDSEIAATTDSRKGGSVETTGLRFREPGFRGRVSLRPTTKLRLEEGDYVRRETQGSIGRTDGFRVSRGRRRNP